ncbi:MAG: 16S rRNA (cytidine(1402)-2'-O)-methyltransferase [Chlamydiia bacterium]
MLFLVGTPIGHMSDLSPRAREVLSQADAIFCEDTRHSRPLLEAVGTRGSIHSLHEHNEQARIQKVLSLLEEGAQVALISDAGLPAVCDPGSVVVKAVRAAGQAVTVIPGPCAFMTLWPALGWELPFQFIGFLPHATQEAKATLIDALIYRGSTLFYESPHRVGRTLQLLAELAPHRRVAIGRELTKKFEEILEDEACRLASHPQVLDPRGEWCLALAAPPAEEQDWLQGSYREQCEYIETTFQLDRMQAIKLVAKLNQVSKKTVYKEVLPQSDPKE